MAKDDIMDCAAGNLRGDRDGDNHGYTGGNDDMGVMGYGKKG